MWKAAWDDSASRLLVVLRDEGVQPWPASWKVGRFEDVNSNDGTVVVEDQNVDRFELFGHRSHDAKRSFTQSWAAT